jgi:oligopeptide transport system substrate-binding protein
MNLRRMACAAVGLALAAGPAGYGAPAGAASAMSKAAISIGIGEPKHGLIPSDTAETQGQLVLTALFTPLAKVDGSGKVTEVAAKSITTTDNKVWTIKLKHGYTFHNGEKVTSDSYIKAWNRAAYKPNEQDGNYLFAKIDGFEEVNPSGDGAEPTAKRLKGLKKIDNFTFRVTLSAPYVAFKAVLVNLAFAPLPKAAFKGTGFDPAFGEAPIGDGPFRMKGSWRHDRSIEVERYNAFPGEKPKVKGILFRIYPDLETQYADLVAGRLDIAPVLPLSKLKEAKATLGDRYRQSPRAGIGSLGFPSFDPKYASTDARKAISMAIDRESIVNTVFDGTRTPAHSFLQPGVAGYRPDSCGEACTFAPARAKELFGKSGFTGPVELTFNIDGGSKDWVDAVCDQIKTNLAVDCVENPIEKYADMLTLLKAHTLGLGVFRSAWTYDYPAPESILGPQYTCASTSNYSGYCNHDVDGLIAAGDAAPDQEEAVKSYQQAEDIIARDLPTVPLWYLRHVYGLGTKVRDVEVNDLGMVDFVKVRAAAPAAQ